MPSAHTHRDESSEARRAVRDRDRIVHGVDLDLQRLAVEERLNVPRIFNQVYLCFSPRFGEQCHHSLRTMGRNQ